METSGKIPPKALWGWVSYDMGNSVFSTTVMAGFFPIFFKSFWSQGVDPTLSTARLGITVSVASLIVALCAPFLGALSDQGGNKRWFLLAFASLGFCFTGLLPLIPAGGWPLAVLAYSGAIFGFYGANLFYDALLPGLAPEDQRDWVSSLGYAFGYLSGGLVFALNLAMVKAPGFFGLEGAQQGVQLSFLTSSVAWALGALLCFFWVPEPKVPPVKALWTQTWIELASTYQDLKTYRTAWTFLVAYWLYIDVVDTLVVMAVDYGLSLGFESGDLILALLMVQLIGFPSALVIAKGGALLGVRRMIYLCLAVYAGVCLWAVGLSVRWEFFLMAGLIGLVQGGVQALSRSYFAGLIPKERAGEFFGFYNMLGKFATILGPALIGGVGLGVTLWGGGTDPHLATRMGFASLLLPLGLGTWLFYRARPNP